jgi:hypothetical protein
MACIDGPFLNELRQLHKVSSAPMNELRSIPTMLYTLHWQASELGTVRENDNVDN